MNHPPAHLLTAAEDVIHFTDSGRWAEADAILRSVTYHDRATILSLVEMFCPATVDAIRERERTQRQ